MTALAVSGSTVYLGSAFSGANSINSNTTHQPRRSRRHHQRHRHQLGPQHQRHRQHAHGLGLQRLCRWVFLGSKIK